MKSLSINAKQVAHMLAATLGLTGPVIAGIVSGHTEAGILAALGGLALSGIGESDSMPAHASELARALIAGSTAILIGASLAGHGWTTTFGIATVAAVVGLLGGLSRPLARASIRFILFMLIAAHQGISNAAPLARMLLFLSGSIWTAGLTLVLEPLMRRIWPSREQPPGSESMHYPFRLLWRRWRGLLTGVWGWQYALRIAVCVIGAGAYERLWPGHHGYWAAITVAIVVRRNLQDSWTRIFQRAIGTTIGVLFTSLLLLFKTPPMEVTIVLIAVCAAARPLFLSTHYIAYSAVVTPLVILLLDFGQATSWAVVIDRLAATFTGCTLALTLGYLVWIRILPPTQIIPDLHHHTADL